MQLLECLPMAKLHAQLCLYVNEPKIYTGTFDLLVFKVILGF